MTEWDFIEESPQKGLERRLVAGTTVGREGCDVLLDDDEVSRRHARFGEGEKGDPVVEDLGSSNGTFVNGDEIKTSTPLRRGDSVRLGTTVWEYTGQVKKPAPASAQARQDMPPTRMVDSPSPQASRGDVPAPEAVPSVVGRKVPALDGGQTSGRPQFTVHRARQIRGSAARRVEATFVSYAIVIATAVSVTVYLGSR